MADNGWVKLHRDITDHWLWDCEFSYAQAWIDLILKACHKPNKLMIKGQLIELKRGQQARSEVTLSKEWKWSRGKVRRFLNQCLNDGMIECEATHLTSIITVCNYDSFQGGDTASDTANDTSGDTPNEHLAVHKQECKELKNVKNEREVIKDKVSQKLDFSSWPSMPSQNLMDEWKALRRRMKATVTQTVVNRTGKELHKALEAGFTVDQCFEQWIYKGWRGFEAAWMTGYQRVKPQSPTHNISGIDYKDSDL